MGGIPIPRLDNLIPLRPSLSGPQLAGWAPGPPAMQGLGCRLLSGERVPVGPGASLAPDVYLPRAPGRYPAVVSFAAYSKELHTAGVPTGSNEIGSPPVFTDRGYARVVVSRRGMGRSVGEPGVYLGDTDIEDMNATIAWAAEQPWCNGEVVMFGTSYYGMSQPLIAVRRPPALKAFFCNEICTDYFRQLFQFGGVPQVQFANVWIGANFKRQDFERRVAPIVRALVSQVLNSRLKPWWERELKKRMTRLMESFAGNTPVREAREWYANWLFDAKTRTSSVFPSGPSAELSEIAIPFVVVQNLGYFNLHQFGCYDLFENASTPAGRKWMILGPAEYELPVYAWQLEALAFFDHILRGTDNGYSEQAPVRYWLDGAERFAGAGSFPIAGSQPTRYWLRSAGEDRAVHALDAAAPSAQSSNSWVAVPLGARVLGGLDDVANQVLSYEIAVDDDVEFSGPVSAHLTFSSNEIDSQVVARLGRVDSAGGYHLLSIGTIRAARRRVDGARSTSCEIAIDAEHPQPLTPGEPVVLCFSLTPVPTRLRAGEKLRFEVASRSDLLRSDVSHGHVQFDLPAPPYFSRNTLHYGPDTYVELHKVQ